MRVLGLLLFIVITTWVTLLLLQASHEGLALQKSQSHFAADYDLHRSSENHHHNNRIRSGKNNSLHRLGLTNGRQPKGIDIALPALERGNSTTDHISASSLPPLDGANNTKVSSLTPPHNAVDAKLKEQVTLDSLPSQFGPNSLQLLKDHMFRLNKEQRVWNADKFPPLATDGIVLIVQVHRREGYLRQLFNSMRNVRGIEKVLLVISHDYYYDDMMQLVRSVDFCRVMQVFYPFSLQVYPDTFPGMSVEDCPRDSTREEALAMNCTNAEHPDTYGHYREAKITAVKHHWWWKVNMVFDGMRETENFTGHVMFLEEDHYLSPDFLYMTEKLIALKEEQCDDCDFVNLGMYTNVRSPATLAHRVSVGVWNAGKNNMGFGMSRKTWELIKSCKEHFCAYDDYNWDWSINSMGQSCLQRHLKVMVAKAPRIFHIGNCGVHHTKVCNEEKDAQKVERKLDSQRSHLFPATINLDGGLNPSPSRKKVKPYGGWGDLRDRELCLSFVGNSLRNVL
jgi:alpha-1,6-mannosyl-glycoprotein beta-1,2-N-acetylglucosaminyltransferase